MNYSWGRTSFLYTISRFLPPPVSVETPDPLHTLRIRLSQKTTACYGFPLALQLLAFEAVPQLLARIPAADNTDDFLDNLSCCGNTVVILNTNDIVAVEGEPDVIVHFSLVPEAERHFWLDEVEDPKVTRLVDHIRSVHTFRTEDFVGGDMSFGKDNAIPEGKPQGVPLIQRTLRPRKRVAVVIEDLTTPEHNEPDVPPESGRSPNEDLKSWILEQFQNFKNGIYERLDQFEKTLCDHFGVPLPNIHNKGKRKRPNRKSRKINSTVPKPGQEMHSYPLRSTVVLEGTIGNTQPGFSRETRENNENSTLLTLQFDQNATDQLYVFKHEQFDQNATYQEPRTPNAVPDESHTPNPLATLTIYRGLLFARPQAYVSPAKKDDTYIGEKAMDVKWDEANPHAYSAVKEVHAGERPSSDPNPESAPDFASTRSEDNVGPISTNLSGQKMQAPVIEGGVPDSTAIQNPTSPVEEDENYESCKENISFDSQLQGKHPRAVEDMSGSETYEDDNYVESGGKRVPKKSQKIHGVYTPDSRLKSDILSENVEQQFAIKTNHIVTNSFFLDIATPGNSLSDEHMHVIMQMFEAKDKLHFDWGTNIASYVTGMCRGKNLKLQLGRDIDVTSNVTIFDSFITANPTETHVDAHMTPILKSLPYILEQYVGFTDYLIKEGERTYAWNRFQGIYHNNRGGDCGPCAAKFMEMHSNGDGKEEMSRITDKVVDKCREQYAMDCYEEFVGDFQVANEAGVK
ncbi:BnaCnng22020D [Brassica napus]|uniref:BnaCnng22020D protein n=1 Tax=Brassica napus TaxID=3708 RepID=A0A078IRN8_BRANA|nr:BnaCnng22020D [Brassica napus]